MNKQFITADEIMKSLDIGRTKAYQIIKDLNAELSDKGYLVIRGKVSRRYFCQRYAIEKAPPMQGRNGTFKRR